MAQRESESAVVEEASNSLLHNSRCCFCFPYFGNSSRSSTGIAFWERIRTSQIKSDDSIWSRAFQKIRGWSEMVAGPRWKTFIRRFNRNRSGGSHNNRQGKFQYDPLSYALNFDEEADYPGFRAFSTRYASPAPSSLDIHKDVAAFG